MSCRPGERGRHAEVNTPDHPLGESAEAELLDHLVRQRWRVPIPYFVSAVVIAAIVWPAAPWWLAAAWLLLIALVIAAQQRFFAVEANRTAIPVARRLRKLVVLRILNGCCFALSLLLTPYLEQYGRLVYTLIVLGLATGAVASTSGYVPLFLAFVVPTLGGIVAVWIAAGSHSQTPWIEGGIAVTTVLFGLLLWTMARDMYRRFRESFEMRRQQEAMNDRLRDALHQAEAANGAKTRFLASASHDLRQPMHTLSLFAEALWLRPLDAPARNIASHLRQALLALGTQLDALLDISKLDANLVEVRRVPVDLSELLRRLGREYAPEAERRGLAFAARIEAGTHCETDPLLLERILRNLVDNAFKYTSRGTIGLSVETRGPEHIVRVADTGCGIAADEQANVFEEFYQVGNAERDRARGLGLGLSIVKRLAGLLGLRLGLQSAPGVGTTVEIAFTAIAAALQASPAFAPGAESIAGLHILVIEDEETVRLAMQALLDELDCSCDLVASSDAALAAAARRKPDIVIADFRLRGIDSGVAAIRRLRQVEPGLAALLISGDTAPDRLVEAQAAGIRMLHKPARLEPLMQAISREVARQAVT